MCKLSLLKPERSTFLIYVLWIYFTGRSKPLRLPLILEGGSISLFFCEVCYYRLPCPYRRVIGFYIAYLFKQRASHGTIRSAWSALAWHHNMNGASDPTKDLRLKKMLVGIKRTAPAAKRVSPFGLSLLRLCLARLRSWRLDRFDRTLLAAILALGYFGCFRIGELTHSGNSDNCILFDNIDIALDNTLILN